MNSFDSGLAYTMILYSFARVHGAIGSVLLVQYLQWGQVVVDTIIGVDRTEMSGAQIGKPSLVPYLVNSL